MSIEEVAFNLANAAVRDAIAAAEAGCSAPRRPQAHLDYERKLLGIALDAAEERPDLEHEIWSVVSSSVCELNDHLCALEVPELKFVNYAIFNAWVAWRLDRTQAGHELAEGSDPRLHTLH